jgi:coproporphyrinogen III oxidase-like Fe-S oxidoreductase
VTAGESPVAGFERLDDVSVELEELYLGLRTLEGVAADRLPQGTAATWLSSGWASTSEGRVRLSAEGWLRLDALAAAVA